MKKDLLILAADSHAQSMLIKLLERFPHVLGVKPFSAQVIVHERRDPGCYTQGVEKLNRYVHDFKYCVLIFDYEGCGAEHKKSAAEIEAELEKQLAHGLWPDRNAVIVMEPELENWIWTDSIHTSKAMGWGNELGELQTWLIAQKWLKPDEPKPERPKEAMEAAVKYKLKTPISASMFGTIAQFASFKNCTSPSFLKFQSTITTWFQEKTP